MYKLVFSVIVASMRPLVLEPLTSHCCAAESRAWVTTLEDVRRINGREEAVVLTDDGKTIVCWHPQPDIPYEMTMVCGAAGPNYHVAVLVAS